MRDTVFNKIVAREIPTHKIYEDDDYLAFLDIFPAKVGQVVLIPKKDPGEYIFAMPDADYLALMEIAKKVANLMEIKLGASKVAIVVEGLEVPYVHIRMYPVMPGEATLSFQPGSKADDAELAEIASKFQN